MSDLIHTALHTAQVQESAYIEGYESGEENGYTAGWIDAHEHADSLSKVVANQDLIIETQDELIKLLQARLAKQPSFAKAFMDDTDNL